MTVAAGAGVVVLAGDEQAAGVLEPESIRLEPVGAQTPDPFVEENLDLGGADVINLGEPPALEDDATTGLSGQTTTGDTPGLYGGSQDAAVCDVERQIAFFEDPANADKAEAWAAAQGIEGDQLGDFLRGLAPVRLRVDTRVTNHSFREGEARPFQSVLQAGTAVLVDERGVPRSKCFCGNPLTPPVSTDAELDTDDAYDTEVLAVNPEDAWEGFDPADVVVVEPSPEPLDTVAVIDPATGEVVEIPVGGPVQADDTAGGGAGSGSGSGGGGGDDEGGGEQANCRSVTETSLTEGGGVAVVERQVCDPPAGGEPTEPDQGPEVPETRSAGDCVTVTVTDPSSGQIIESRQEC